MSKEQSKALEVSEAGNSLKEPTKHGKAWVDKMCENLDNKMCENSERDMTDSTHKEIPSCKCCGGKHWPVKKSCPAFGKKCLACGKMNHFAP